VSTKRIDYGDERELLKHFNDDLVYVRNMNLEGASCLSLLVQRRGKDCVLKVRKKTNNFWDEKYFFYELHALRRAGERNVKGVNRLLKNYDCERYQGLLKPYIPGTPGNRKDPAFLEDPEFVRRLDQLYLRLHLAGISNINFLPRKIVFADDGDITLVDLSTCLVNTEIGVQQFNLTMKEDSQFITMLERRIKKIRKLHKKLEVV
jgi:hypothetical protein